MNTLMRSWRGIIAALLTVVTMQANATVSCENVKVERLYSQNDLVYVVLSGYGWHVLGNTSDSDIQQKMAKLRHAKQRSQLVTLTFPDGYDASCRVMNDSLAVQTIKVHS